MKSSGYLVPKLICFLLVNLFILNAGAQIATTVYCTKKGQETKRNDSAYFSRTIVPMADQAMSYFKIEEHYFANNAIKLIGTAQDTGVILKFVGKLQEFYDNGGKKSVKKDLGFGTGAEGVRVLKMAERWKPGISRGEPIRVMYTMPIQLNSNP